MLRLKDADTAFIEVPPVRHRGLSTVATEFDPRSNNFGFLRFMFATVVVIGHAFPLGGFNGNRDPVDVWTRSQETLGGIAVGGFFVISGFLITRSFSASSSTPNYFWRRCLRILPAFWVCLLFTAFIAAPLAWWHEQGTLKGFLGVGPDSAFDYIRQNFLISVNQWGVAGLLEENPWPGAFNGSLWTLIYEVKCYVGLGAVGVLGVLRRGRGVVLALFLAFWTLQVATVVAPGLPADIWPGFQDVFMIRFPLAFLLGAVVFLYQEKMVLSGRVAAIAALAVIFGLYAGVHQAAGPVCLGYIWLWLAVRLPFQRFNAHGDFSYGLYIYAFPVQQLTTLYGVNRQGLVPYILVTMVLTTALAVASWRLVEWPALKYKNLWALRPSEQRDKEELDSHLADQVPPEAAPLREFEAADRASEAKLRGVAELGRGRHQ